MKLYVIQNGYIENDYANIVLNPYIGVDSNREPKARWMQVPVYTVLIETSDRVILFDTACHPLAMSERWPESQQGITPYHCEEENQLLPSLGRIGYLPDDVDVVVASHLHEDHAGGLEFFTKSEIYVHENELKNVLALYAMRGEMGAYIPNDIGQWLERGLNWRMVPGDSGDVDVAEGVTVLNLGPGHCFGVLALHVQLPKTGGVIICSDSINAKVNYGPPARLNGFPYDSIGYLKTVERIRRLADRCGAQVWFSHDMEQFATLTKSDSGYYE
jgi:N-acyl homoserine lactone hydrolase